MARGSQSALVIDLTDIKSFKKSLRRYQKMHTYYQSRKTFFNGLERDIKRNYMRPMLKELRAVPSHRRYPEDYPIEFKSDKQRRYVMMILKGKPYKRRNILSKNWKVRIFARANMLRIKVTNDTPYRKYVMGYYGMGKSRRSIKRYIKPMQPFHAKTGWPPAYEIIQKYTEDAREYARKESRIWVEKGLQG